MPTIRILGPGDAAALDRVAEGVFDNAVDPRWTAEFLADSRHHLAVAVDDGRVVGMASAVHHVHPDKPPELWIDEVGVAPTHAGSASAASPARRPARARPLPGLSAGVGGHRAGNAAARRLYRRRAAGNRPSRS